MNQNQDISREFAALISALRSDLSYRHDLGFLEWITLSVSSHLPAPVSSPPKKVSPCLSPQQKGQLLEELRREIGVCTRCKLHAGRQKIVFGVGDPNARLVFVGEGPGRDEDIQGEPFVGKAGQLLTRIIQAIGLKRQNVYIANIVKCRPPENRNPQPDEIRACEPFLLRQLNIIRPSII